MICLDNVMLNYCSSVYLSDNLGEDCPVFDNLFEFCQIYAGGTIGKIGLVNMLLLLKSQIHLLTKI